MNDLTSSLMGTPLPSGRTTPADVDPLDDMLAIRRDAAISRRIREADAEKEARVSQLSRQYDMPATIISADLPGFEAQIRTGRAQRVMGEYPAIAKWSQKGSNASIAADDYDNLGLMGSVFASRIAKDKQDLLTSTGFIDRMGDLFKSGVYSLDQGAVAVRGALQDWSARNPLPWTSAENTAAAKASARSARGMARIYQDVAGAPVAGETDWETVKGRPTPGNILKFGLDQGVKSVPGMAQAALMLPVYVLGQAGNIGLTRANVQGREDANIQDVAEAAPAAVLSGVLERIGIHGIFGATGKNGLIRAAQAGATEGMTEFGQSMVEYIGGHSQTGTQFNTDEMLDQAFAGAVAGGIIGGGMRGGIEVTGPAARRARAVVKRFTAANVAAQDNQFLENLAEAVKGSKLKSRAPDVLASLAQQLGEDAGVEHVFISAEAVDAYLTPDANNNYFGDTACPWRT